MLATKSDRATESLQSCKAFVAEVSRSIKELELRVTELKDVPKYTPLVRRKIVEIESAISDKRIRLSEAEKMQEFPIDSWVAKNLNRPGRVVDWVFAGQIPEVHVLWSGNTAPVPERPFQLRLLRPDDVEYIWNDDRFPKLVRRIDREECGEIEILQNFLRETQTLTSGIDDPDFNNDVQRKVTYLKKRIAKINEPVRDRISIAKINRDGGTQQRVKLNHETVAEYAEAMEAGDKFPPVKLTYDGTNYWLTDGFHTTEAAWSIGDKFIDAILVPGTQRDAILVSVAANADHGLRRTNADKRRAVTTLLEDKEWSQWSNREIAKRCKVTEGLVRKIKNERARCVQYAANKCTNEQQGCVQYAVSKCTNKESDLTAFKRSDNHKSYINKYGNVSTMRTENIGQGSAPTASRQAQVLSGLAVSKENLEILANSGGDLINQYGEPIDSSDWSDKTCTKQDSSCPGKQPTVQISCPDIETKGNRHLVEQFEIGQLVKLQLSNFDGASEDLKLANHSYGQVTAPTENKCSLNVKVFGHKSFVVSPQDLKPVESVSFCVEFSSKQFIALMSVHQTRNGLENAIKKGVLGK